MRQRYLILIAAIICGLAFGGPSSALAGPHGTPLASGYQGMCDVVSGCSNYVGIDCGRVGYTGSIATIYDSATGASLQATLSCTAGVLSEVDGVGGSGGTGAGTYNYCDDYVKCEVAQLYDQSGNGNNRTAPHGNRPIYAKPSACGPLAVPGGALVGCMYFLPDVTSRYLTTGVLAGSPGTPTSGCPGGTALKCPMSAVTVAAMNGGNSDEFILWSDMVYNNSVWTGNYMSIATDISALGSVKLSSAYANSFTTGTSTSPGIPVLTWFVAGGSWDNNIHTRTPYLNGVTGTPDTSTLTTYPTTQNSITTSGWISSTSPYIQAALKGFIISQADWPTVLNSSQMSAICQNAVTNHPGIGALC